MSAVEVFTLVSSHLTDRCPYCLWECNFTKHCCL